MRAALLQLILLIGVVGCSQEPSINPDINPNLFTQASPAGKVFTLPTFEIAELTAPQTVRVYLPPAYHQSEQRYPVIYLLDGQNVFDIPGAAKGSWLMDKTADALIAGDVIPGVILVAIDNTALRVQEYVPYPFSGRSISSRRTQAPQLAKFIATTLKPQIDSQYRTLPNQANTGIVGASFGAFFALYSAVEYPEVYGMVGALSTSFAASEPRARITQRLSSTKQDANDLGRRYAQRPAVAARPNREHPPHMARHRLPGSG